MNSKSQELLYLPKILFYQTGADRVPGEAISKCSLQTNVAGENLRLKNYPITQVSPASHL